MTRIFVRNIPAQATVEDLKALFAKVSPVSEVYVPLPTITTWRRNFAIVTIEGDDTEGKKCVKALNGAVWKGEKLTIEVANEYYKERIVREKEDEVDSLYLAAKRAQEALIVVPPPPVTKEVISLRRNKAQELPNVISMKPSIGDKPSKPKKNAKKVIVPCGVKLIFDEDLLTTGRINYAEDSSDSEAEPETKTTAANAKTADSKPALPEVGAGAEMAKIVNKLNSGEVKAIGGGLRKGFGTVSLPVAEPKPVVAAPKVIDFYTPAHKVDCCVEEHDLHVPVHLLDEDEQSVEEEACLTEADLLPEVLTSDRSRALDIFNNLPIGPDGLVVIVNKKKAAKEAAAALKNPAVAVAATVAVVSGAGDGSVVAASTSTTTSANTASATTSTTTTTTTNTTTGKTPLEKKVNVAAPADEDIFMIESDIAIEPLTQTKPHKDMVDVLNAMKQEMGLAVGEDAGGKAEKSDKTKKSEKKEAATIAAAPAADTSAATSSTSTTTTSSATTEGEEMQSTKDGYANLNVLKNIFYKEGGVWWGDDGTLSGAVSKGNAALDPLFLEAEKHGIDIRTAKKMSGSGSSGVGSSSAGSGGMFNFGIDSSTGGGSGGMDVVAEPEEEEKQMLFGFFGGDDSTSADVPVNPFLTNTNTTTATNTTTVNTTDTTADTTAGVVAAAEPKVRVNTLLEDSTVASNVVKGKAVEVVFSAAQLVALAKKFAREKSVDELTTEWREGRDRLVLDYKRKRKDMKRRTAAWSNSLPATSSNTPSEKPERTHGSGSGSAGSVAGSSRGPQYMRGKRGGANRKRARKA